MLAIFAEARVCVEIVAAYDISFEARNTIDGNDGIAHPVCLCLWRRLTGILLESHKPLGITRVWHVASTGCCLNHESCCLRRWFKLVDIPHNLVGEDNLALIVHSKRTATQIMHTSMGIELSGKNFAGPGSLPLDDGESAILLRPGLKPKDL